MPSFGKSKGAGIAKSKSKAFSPRDMDYETVHLPENEQVHEGVEMEEVMPLTPMGCDHVLTCVCLQEDEDGGFLAVLGSKGASKMEQHARSPRSAGGTRRGTVGPF